MPRQSKVSVEYAVAVIKRFMDYFLNDEIPAWSHHVWKKMARALKEALGFWSPCFKIDCRNGCRRKVTRTSTPREHIFIKLDVRRPDDLKRSLFSTLNDFAPIIKLKSKEQSTDYRLVGVVQHLAGRYLAHCWRTGGYWEKFNNLQKKSGNRVRRLELNHIWQFMSALPTDRPHNILDDYEELWLWKLSAGKKIALSNKSFNRAKVYSRVILMYLKH